MTEQQPRRREPAGPAEQSEALPDLLLDDQLCFTLYTASRAFTGCYRAALAATGLTYSQYLVMLVLWEEDRVRPAGSGLSLKAVGERLSLDNGTLSPLVKRLQGLGLVTRRRSHTDERLLEVACTPAGRALYRETVLAQAAVAEATGLAPAELAELLAVLRTVTHRLRSHAQDAEPAARAERAS